MLRKKEPKTAILRGFQPIFFGPPEGIRTPGLQNRSLTHYPAVLRAEIIFSFSSALRQYIRRRRCFSAENPT